MTMPGRFITLEGIEGVGKSTCIRFVADYLSSRGIPVLISNHNTHFTQQAYQMATQRDTFQVRRYISCNGEKRQNAGEVLALFT